MRFLSFVLALTFSFAVFATTPKVITIGVKGMVCSSCEEQITKSVMELPGVESVKADHAAGKAIITLKPDSKTSESQIKETITKAGYKVDG